MMVLLAGADHDSFALMRPERAIFDKADPHAEDAADARADADIRAGKIVDHADVAAWLAKWGAEDEAPVPPEWLA